MLVIRVLFQQRYAMLSGCVFDNGTHSLTLVETDSGKFRFLNVKTSVLDGSRVTINTSHTQVAHLPRTACGGAFS